MFIFWGPFFFFFPFLVIYLFVRGFSGSTRGSRGGFFGREGPFDPFGLYPPGVENEHSLRVKIYQLAYRLGGSITVSDIVVETGLDVEEAERLVESMVDNQRVRMEVKEDGLIVYEFPEILSRYREGNREDR